MPRPAFLPSSLLLPALLSTSPSVTSSWPSRAFAPKRHYRPAASIVATLDPISISNRAPPPTKPSLSTFAILTSVPLLWGSYGPAIKLIFNSAPYLHPALVNLLTYIAAAASLSLIPSPSSPPTAPASPSAGPSLARAGAELGLYLFLGSYIQLISLTLTSATRSAVLTQLTTVLVPACAVLLGQEPARLRTAFAAIAAFAGVGVLSAGGRGIGGLSLNSGDWLSVASAAIYTLHVIRLQVLLPAFPDAVALVREKVNAQIIFSVVACFVVMHGPDVLSAWDGVRASGAAALAVAGGGMLWCGAFSSALSTVLQVDGQRRVGPSASAVVFSFQPVFAALFALLFLHDHPSSSEMIGGVLVVLAGITVVL